MLAVSTAGEQVWCSRAVFCHVMIDGCKLAAVSGQGSVRCKHGVAAPHSLLWLLQ
jgi:hypothetical protein